MKQVRTDLAKATTQPQESTYRGEKRDRAEVERAVEEIRLAKQRPLREIVQKKQEEPIVW